MICNYSMKQNDRKSVIFCEFPRKSCNSIALSDYIDSRCILCIEMITLLLHNASGGKKSVSDQTVIQRKIEWYKPSNGIVGKLTIHQVYITPLLIIHFLFFFFLRLVEKAISLAGSSKSSKHATGEFQQLPCHMHMKC